MAGGRIAIGVGGWDDCDAGDPLHIEMGGFEWAGALAGIAFRVPWVGAPRWPYTPCYVALGWAPVRYLLDFLHTAEQP